jgi:ferredoxin-NADP reductase
MEFSQKILSVTPVTHDVNCIRLEKPKDFIFVPGQATDVALDKPGWQNELRPFTFTCLNDDPYLEFTIKSYSDHDGVTKQIGQLKAGDRLVIHEPWGAIEYKGEGYFIAGGAGITPFIAILRQLHKENRLANNKLFFSNKTAADIIYEEELAKLLGDGAVFIVTDQPDKKYTKGFINEEFLKKNVDDFNKQFYVCGPDPMIKAISDILVSNGANPNSVTFEK